MASKTPCGPLTEILENSAVRVARCACGVVHVTFVASGVTMRMPLETFKNVAAGFHASVDKVEPPPVISATGSTSIN